MEHWWYKTDIKLKSLRETCSTATLSTTDPKWNGMGYFEGKYMLGVDDQNSMVSSPMLRHFYS
jgi:hypothetical protein